MTVTRRSAAKQQPRPERNPNLLDVRDRTRGDELKIALTILKGAIEHQDTARHFGSLGAHQHYREQMAEIGWLERYRKPCQEGAQAFEIDSYRATDVGVRVYRASGVASFDDSPGYRWMFWKWETLTPFEVP